MLETLKSKKKIIIGIICLIVLLVVVITGLSSKKSKTKDIDTANNTSTDIISLDDSNMNSAIDKILDGEDVGNNACVDPEKFIHVDLASDSHEVVGRYYGDHALFVKVKTVTDDTEDYSIVRFQLNDDNKISDCIVYKIAN